MGYYAALIYSSTDVHRLQNIAHYGAFFTATGCRWRKKVSSLTRMRRGTNNQDQMPSPATGQPRYNVRALRVHQLSSMLRLRQKRQKRDSFVGLTMMNRFIPYLVNSIPSRLDGNHQPSVPAFSFQNRWDYSLLEVGAYSHPYILH